jgi:hypothetical protein
MPFLANGWQLAAACYGIVFGLRLVWPVEMGLGQSARVLALLGLPFELIGLCVLGYAIASIIAVLAIQGRGYWCPFLAAVGSTMWTMVGIMHGVGEIATHYPPLWGGYECLLGIGLSLATVQRARDPLAWQSL